MAGALEGRVALVTGASRGIGAAATLTGRVVYTRPFLAEIGREPRALDGR